MRVSFDFLGRTFHMEAGPDAFLRDDSLWRVRDIYERFLSANSLPLSGVAIDIGAGFGAFAVPFALCFPEWKIWCFEPNREAFAALCANIRTHNISNIMPFDLAVGAASENLPNGLVTAIKTGDATAVRKIARHRPYFQHKEKPAFLEIDTAKEALKAFIQKQYPEIPANALHDLAPDFLKLTAPKNETNILGALGASGLSFLTGETWTYVPSNLVYLPEGRGPRCYLRIAGHPTFGLQQCLEANGLIPGLDIIKTYAQLQEQEARYRHVAFLNSDSGADMPYFQHLLECARYSGADIVEGQPDVVPTGKGSPWQIFRGMSGKSANASVDEARLYRIYRRDFLDHHDLWKSRPQSGDRIGEFHALCLEHDPMVVDMGHFPNLG